MAPKEHTLTIWGSKILVVEAGNPRGETILMSDGWLGSWRAFSRLIPYLESSYHLFIVATPGFGESEELKFRNSIEANAELLREIIDRLKIHPTKRKKLYFLGLSFGGSVGLHFAATYPAYLTRLIVQGAPIGPFPRWMRFVGTFVLRPWVHGITKMFIRSRLIITLICKLHPDLRHMGKRHVASKLKQFSSASSRAVIESAHSVLNADLRNDCRIIFLPTLIIDGDRTLLLPKLFAWVFDSFIFSYLNTAKTMHMLVPGSTIVIIPDASHTVSTQKPKEFAAAIMDFLKP